MEAGAARATMPCSGVEVDGTCWRLSEVGETCEEICGSLSAIDFDTTLRSHWRATVVTALTARYSLGDLFWSSPPAPPTPPALDPPPQPRIAAAAPPSPPVRPPLRVFETWIEERRRAAGHESGVEMRRARGLRPQAGASSPVFADKLGAPCGAAGQASMYLFLPIASGWGCYDGERPDEADGQFRLPCACQPPPPVDALGAVELGVLGALVAFVAIALLGMSLDAIARARLQRARRAEGRRQRQQMVQQMQLELAAQGHAAARSATRNGGRSMPMMGGGVGGGMGGMGGGMPMGGGMGGMGGMPMMGGMGGEHPMASLPPPQRSWAEESGELEMVAARISLTVAAARDLPAMDTNALTAIGAQRASSDPYVKVRFGTRRYQTRVVHDTLFPTWDEEFALEARAQPACLQGLAAALVPCWALPQLHAREEIVLTVLDQVCAQ